jgi:hypothetical protein
MRKCENCNKNIELTFQVGTGENAKILCKTCFKNLLA